MRDVVVDKKRRDVGREDKTAGVLAVMVQTESGGV